MNLYRSSKKMNYYRDIYIFKSNTNTRDISLEQKLENTNNIIELVGLLIDIEIVRILRNQLITDGEKKFPVYQFDVKSKEIAEIVTDIVVMNNNIKTETLFTEDNLVAYIAKMSAMKLSDRINNLNMKK